MGNDAPNGPPDLKVIEGGKARFVVGGDHSLVMTTSEVMIERYLRYTLGGKEVGSINIKFDISKVDPALHMMVVNYLMESRTSVELGAVAHIYWPDQYEEPAYIDIWRRREEAEKKARARRAEWFKWAKDKALFWRRR